MTERTRKLMKLIKHVGKLKKILKKSEGRKCGGDDGENLVSSPSVICCDELFFESEKKKGKSEENSTDDLFTTAYIAAQRHFTLRPNIYI
ncbi:hypothetical protein PanWU01x14_306260 [Parasponia andersonii]|uniref:Uncharacterized protein n=1 Tax=Parasponia andersonii TaxID=3476 RepID=A0A2P5AS41_PARAD|nr:hypothetical protein PanWU01x14_306260 [Parasponia andersonii]